MNLRLFGILLGAAAMLRMATVGAYAETERMDGGPEAFTFPRGITLSRSTSMGRGFLLHREVFYAPVDPDELFSFYQTAMEAYGWVAWNNPFDQLAGCPDCSAPVLLPENPLTRHYIRKRAYFTVHIMSLAEPPTAEWILRIPLRDDLPIPELEQHLPIYPYGKTLRRTHMQEGDRAMDIYEFQCADQPELFFRYLNDSLSRVHWRVNTQVAWLNALVGQHTLMLYEKDNRQVSILAGEENMGKWTYTIIYREHANEQG